MPRNLPSRILAPALAFLIAACGGGDSPSAPPTVQSISLTPSTATLTASGQTTTLSASVRLSDGSTGSQSVSWSSSTPAVATVSGGTVTAVSSGTTNITASVGSVSSQAAITVAIPVVQTITVTATSPTLTAVGQTTTVAAEVRMSNGALGTQTPVWSSSNTSVATVSAAGVVTAVATGSTNIIATVGAVTGQVAVAVAIPTVQSITVTPATGTIVSLGATTTLAAQVRLSNGAAGTQTPVWSSANTAIATVNNAGVVTAVANGTVNINATVGAVVGTAVVTVAQAVASVRILPTDTVIKTNATLRGAALDARGNVIAGASLQWTAVTPIIATTNQSGSVTPLVPGVARIRVSSGNFSSTAIVRSIANVVALNDLAPLFEYSALAGQRKAYSDVSQSHADARAALMGSVWSYLETIFPSSGSAVTEMYFTTWPDIWLEASPFCGGTLFPNQAIYQSCTTPFWKHYIVPGTSPNDFVLVTRWLSRQFLLSSMTTAGAFPWFLGGYTQWLAGGSLQGSVVVGATARVHVIDFRAGDTQGTLAPLDTLVRMTNVRFFQDIAIRTPVAVRQAQSVLFVSYIDVTYPTIIPAILARIRATPGNAFTNDMLLQEIVTRTGKTVEQLDAAYLAYARALPLP